MILAAKIAIVLPSIVFSYDCYKNKYTLENYPIQHSIRELRNKNTLEYNTITTEELIIENNQKLIDLLYKELE